MANVLIRLARREDVPVIADFNCRLAWETEQKQLDTALVLRGVHSLCENPQRGRYFVAEVAGEVQGQLMHTCEWSDWRNGDLWWLQSVYVAAPFRGQGLFRKLVQHVEDLARSTCNRNSEEGSTDGTSERVVGLRLYVNEHNLPAQETYRRLGFATSGYLVMERMWAD